MTFQYDTSSLMKRLRPAGSQRDISARLNRGPAEHRDRVDVDLTAAGTDSAGSDSLFDLDPDKVDEFDENPPPKRSIVVASTKKPHNTRLRRGAARKFDRKHRAAIRLLAADGWSPSVIKNSCPLDEAVGIMTIHKVIANGYVPADNVDSDCEYTQWVQAYKDKRKERRDVGRPTQGVGSVAQGPLGQRKILRCGNIAEQRVQKTRVRGPSNAERHPAPESKTVKKPEEPGTRELRAFLRKFPGERNTEDFLWALGQGGISDDETFHAISKWNNKELVEFFKQFEESGWLNKFQWSSLKRGLLQLRKEYPMATRRF
ncbi:hypothetical protein BJ138DRAFT_460783 [Hygrophoropsis aurantiaca]|uniref:Uncharacterized protein n=1 Tax=Hygrophoropsis aurantiaca TaxID=72124 RepID=A0ACB8A3S8_9AGAM|nr:hypothetical protein BJ138DRAFT_460783 [Hygrophoropsis aurantiaca]